MSLLNAYSLHGTLPERAWARTFISPISGRQRDTYHSFLVPSAPAHQIPTWHHKLVNALNATGRKGSNVYEMNLWVWQFGRGNPQLGGLSAADKEDR